jgi:hypothetical protein
LNRRICQADQNVNAVAIGEEELQQSNEGQRGWFSTEVGDGDRSVFEKDPFHYDQSVFSIDQLEALKAYGLSNDEVIALNMYTGLLHGQRGCRPNHQGEG